MRIYRSLDECGRDFGPCALSIGNFDGVHTGHRRILRRVVELAAQRGWKPSALTFDPHPLRVVAAERAPRLLSTPEERARLMAELGIEQALILPFTPEVACLGPEAFATEILRGKLDARAVLVGDNFRFGRQHAGGTGELIELGRRLGFTTEIVPPVRMRGHMVSSSEIRRLIAQGEVMRAARLLARPYGLEGEVTAGQGVGSTLTVPTLNLTAHSEVLPAAGVYITRTCDLGSGREWASVSNLGFRPTFGGFPLTLETHLLDPLSGEPPRRIRVDFLRRLRDERKFEHAQALKTQILADVARAQAFFRRLRAKN